MERYVTGAAIKALREKKELTQKALAERVLVSDKTVSKWETGKGLPDVTLLEPPPLSPEEPDEDHSIRVERVENDWYLTLDHPMTKAHFICFFAYVAADRVLLQRTYPEQACGLRFPRMGSGRLYACCSHHGLFQVRLGR